MRISFTGIVIALTVELVAGVEPAHAYIDPGTGSSLFSSLGLMLGFMVTMFAFCIGQFRRCSGWFMAKIATRNDGKVESGESVSSDIDSVN